MGVLVSRCVCVCVTYEFSLVQQESGTIIRKYLHLFVVGEPIVSFMGGSRKTLEIEATTEKHEKA